MRKSNLITETAILRNILGMTVEEARDSVGGYEGKSIEEIELLLRCERQAKKTRDMFRRSE